MLLREVAPKEKLIKIREWFFVDACMTLSLEFQKTQILPSLAQVLNHKNLIYSTMKCLMTKMTKGVGMVCGMDGNRGKRKKKATNFCLFCISTIRYSPHVSLFPALEMFLRKAKLASVSKFLIFATKQKKKKILNNIILQHCSWPGQFLSSSSTAHILLF